MRTAKTTKLFRDRERDQEMIARQTLLQLYIEPFGNMLLPKESLQENVKGSIPKDM
jgi:hypothetical protein